MSAKNSMIWVLKTLCFWAAITIVGAYLLFHVSIISAKKFDEVCVRGRISEEQAQMLNKTDWNKNNILNGIVNEDDRVLNRDCSELSRKLMGRNIKRGPNK